MSSHRCSPVAVAQDKRLLKVGSGHSYRGVIPVGPEKAEDERDDGHCGEVPLRLTATGGRSFAVLHAECRRRAEQAICTAGWSAVARDKKSQIRQGRVAAQAQRHFL